MTGLPSVDELDAELDRRRAVQRQEQADEEVRRAEQEAAERVAVESAEAARLAAVRAEVEERTALAARVAPLYERIAGEADSLNAALAGRVAELVDAHRALGVAVEDYQRTCAGWVAELRAAGAVVDLDRLMHVSGYRVIVAPREQLELVSTSPRREPTIFGFPDWVALRRLEREEQMLSARDAEQRQDRVVVEQAQAELRVAQNRAASKARQQAGR